MSLTALIVAAGSGQRLGGGVPKQYRPLGGKPVLRWAVEAMVRHPLVDAVRVVVGAGQEQSAEEALRGLEVGDLVIGADHRAGSVINGLRALPVKTERVLIHDAARPFCPPAVVDRLVDALRRCDAAIPVLGIADTLTRVSAEQSLGEPIDRSEIFRVQTPQAFRLDVLLGAIEEWRSVPPADEAAYFQARRTAVALVEGDGMLDKLTDQVDWGRAEALLAARLVSRTGIGFDVHRFAGPGPIMLGGVAVPSDRGLAGHSDADVALHAITDALLGAAGLGDIGEHFPPSDQRWRGAASARFLAHAGELIRAAGGMIDHVDCTIICETPKVSPHRAAMCARIAEILAIEQAAVSIKATTTERLGFTGRGEGIAAQAVATIRMEKSR